MDPELTSELEEEFVATENILCSKHPPASVGTSSDDDTVTVSNIDHSTVEPDSPCPIHPTGNHKRGECSLYQPHPSKALGSLTFSPIQDNLSTPSENMTADDNQAELMRWHHRLGHLPFLQLKALSEKGEIPKRLSKVKLPFCAGCAFGAMTKQPSHHKGEKKAIFVATKPGECV